MPSARDRADHFGTVLRQPPQHKESPLSPIPFERSKQRVDTLRDATRVREPVVTSDDGLHCFHLKVLLHIYREEMGLLELDWRHEVSRRQRERAVCAGPHERTSNASLRAEFGGALTGLISLQHNDKRRLSNTRTVAQPVHDAG